MLSDCCTFPVGSEEVEIGAYGIEAMKTRRVWMGTGSGRVLDRDRVCS